MGLKKDIKEIRASLDDLNKSLSKQIIDKANRMDETEKYLENVKIQLKSVKMTVTGTGEEQLKIEYEVEPVYLQFDPDNNIIYNPTFYSMNMLNLLSPADMAKVSSAIEKAKIKKK
jgi:hypothetical protein